MRSEQDQIRICRNLALGAKLYQMVEISDGDFTQQFHDAYAALRCFLGYYAHARQGAPAIYPDLARGTLSYLFKGKITTITSSDAIQAWKYYQDSARGRRIKGLNRELNPMNSRSGVLTVMASSSITNLASYTRDQLQKGKTQDIHKLLMSIQGVGTKIASLYLRDITHLGKLNEWTIPDAHLLQPIDTWIGQSLKILFGDLVPSWLKDQQQRIIQLCTKAKCSPIAYNQGAWYIGSQVARDPNTFEKIATGHQQTVTSLRQRSALTSQMLDKLVSVQ